MSMSMMRISMVLKVAPFHLERSPTMACSGRAISRSLMQGLLLAAVRARR
jgi:hypothetical protein